MDGVGTSQDAMAFCIPDTPRFLFLAFSSAVDDSALRDYPTGQLASH
jgi:hypothetical protein